MDVIIDLFVSHLYHLAAYSQRLANYSGRTQPSVWDFLRAMRRIHPLRTIAERRQFADGLFAVSHVIGEAEEKLPLPTVRFPLRPQPAALVGPAKSSADDKDSTNEIPHYSYPWIPPFPAADKQDAVKAEGMEMVQEGTVVGAEKKRRRTSDRASTQKIEDHLTELSRQHYPQQLLKGSSGPFAQIQAIIHQDEQSARDLLELEQASVAQPLAELDKSESIDMATSRIDGTLENLIQPDVLRNPPRDTPAMLEPISATSVVTSHRDALENGLYGQDLNEDCRWLRRWLNRTRTHATVPWVLDPEEIQQLEKGFGGNTVYAELDQLSAERERRLEEIRKRKDAEEAERLRQKREAEEAERRKEEELRRIKEELETSRQQQLERQQTVDDGGAAQTTTSFIDFSRLAESRAQAAQQQQISSMAGIVEEDFEAEMQAEMNEEELVPDVNDIVTPVEDRNDFDIGEPDSQAAIHAPAVTSLPPPPPPLSSATVDLPAYPANEKEKSLERQRSPSSNVEPPRQSTTPLPKIKIKLTLKKPPSSQSDAP